MTGKEAAMARTVKDMLASAHAEVPKLSPAEAVRKLAEPGVVVVDVRDPAELAQNGKLAGSVNVPRGMLEFRADADSPYHDKALDPSKTVLVHCASGGRSALAGQTLKAMGYDKVFNIGGFKDLAEAGAPTEKG
jgi:rhodanese-related sulfurtransferase